MSTQTMVLRPLRRRELLAGAAVLAGVALTGTTIAAGGASAAGISSEEFLSLSKTLTARARLDPIISARALAALSAEDPSFAANAARLHDAMMKAGFRDMRRYRTFIADLPDLDTVAKKTISAWYLGYTGQPAGESNVDNARFVSFAGALMYEPTRDVTIVPTFARGHTDYWVDPPATLATD